MTNIQGSVQACPPRHARGTHKPLSSAQSRAQECESPLLNETPKLLLTSSRSEERGPTREVPDSSASQHSVRNCLACGEPLAADLIADDIRRHIGCDAA